MKFIVTGANAGSSFIMRTPVAWKKAVPPDSTTLANNSLRTLTSHFVMFWKEVSWILTRTTLATAMRFQAAALASVLILPASLSAIWLVHKASCQDHCPLRRLLSIPRRRQVLHTTLAKPYNLRSFQELLRKWTELRWSDIPMTHRRDATSKSHTNNSETQSTGNPTSTDEQREPQPQPKPYPQTH